MTANRFHDHTELGWRPNNASRSMWYHGKRDFVSQRKDSNRSVDSTGNLTSIIAGFWHRLTIYGVATWLGNCVWEHGSWRPWSAVWDRMPNLAGWRSRQQWGTIKQQTPFFKFRWLFLQIAISSIAHMDQHWWRLSFGRKDGRQHHLLAWRDHKRIVLPQKNQPYKHKYLYAGVSVYSIHKWGYTL